MEAQRSPRDVGKKVHITNVTHVSEGADLEFGVSHRKNIDATSQRSAKKMGQASKINAKASMI